LTEDVRGLDARLEALNQNSVIPPGEALSLMALQQRASGALEGTQIQLPGPDIMGEGYTVRQARASLDELVRSLQSQNEDFEALLPTLETQIKQLNVQLEEEQYQLDQLREQRDLARSAYRALSGQLEETRITLSQGDQTAKVAAQAWASEEPSGPNTLMNTALAGVVGLMLAVGAVFVVEWWRDEPAKSDEVISAD
jgi:TolA-binding protein